MRVSVAMCTCDGERFVAEQLDSIAAQSRRPDQVVICDDASSDRTRAIVAERTGRWAAEGIDVVMLANARRLGVAANFSVAIARADGDLILTADQDDRWRADKVQRLVALFEADAGLALAHTDAALIDASGDAVGPSLLAMLGVDASERRELAAGRAFPILLKRNVVTGATMAFRRELAAGALPVPPAWLHDEWLAMVASVDGATRLLDFAAIDYRLHDANAVGVKSLLGQIRSARTGRAAAQFYSRQIERIGQLDEWLSGRPRASGRAPLLDAVARKRAHLERCSGFAVNPAIRAVQIAREWIGGDYRRYGFGWRSAARDLLLSGRRDIR